MFVACTSVCVQKHSSSFLYTALTKRLKRAHNKVESKKTDGDIEEDDTVGNVMCVEGIIIYHMCNFMCTNFFNTYLDKRYLIFALLKLTGQWLSVKN